MLVGFRIPWTVFRVPNPRILDFISKNSRIPDSTSRNFPGSGIQIPLHWAISYLKPRAKKQSKWTERSLYTTAKLMVIIGSTYWAVFLPKRYFVYIVHSDIWTFNQSIQINIVTTHILATKGTQLILMRIRYHFLADLCITRYAFHTVFNQIW